MSQFQSSATMQVALFSLNGAVDFFFVLRYDFISDVYCNKKNRLFSENTLNIYVANEDSNEGVNDHLHIVILANRATLSLFACFCVVFTDMINALKPFQL